MQGSVLRATRIIKTKVSVVECLTQLALQDNRQRFPNLPEGARYIKPYDDKTANGLTRCIIDFLRFNGYQAERISVTGRYINNSRVVSDILGNKRRIGSGKWIKASMQPGTADISAIIKGRSVKIEVKIGKDKQSKKQKEYQGQIEAAGGIYLVTSSFAEFIEQYKKIMGTIPVKNRKNRYGKI